MSELQEQVKRLLITMEHMSSRPGMYIAHDRNALLAFLHGLSIGSSLAGIHIANSAPDKIYGQILQERGWDTRGAMHVSSQMEARGYTVDQIIEETMRINIEPLKRRYNISDSDEKQA